MLLFKLWGHTGNKRNIYFIPVFLKGLKVRKKAWQAVLVVSEISENKPDHSFSPLLFYGEKMFNLKKLSEFDVSL